MESESIDLIVSDFCFEHLSDPRWVSEELTRILKPGGWICARTPNRWGYIALGGRLFPNSVHSRLLRHLQPTRQEFDIFPTMYRLNTWRQVRTLFPPSIFLDCTYGYNAEPAYFGDSLLAMRIAKVLIDSAPEKLSALLYIFLQKSQRPI